MGPKRSIREGQDVGEILHFGTGVSELGTVLVASSQQGVVAVLIGGSKKEVVDDLERRFRGSKTALDQDGQKAFIEEVVAYIKKPWKNIDFKVDLRGTPFQKKIWQAVRRIPLGQTTTYSALATDIGHAKAIRAVGAACTVNPYAFAVP
jgi:AraC family transcriptional regulator of adaptative response/methylated-DNA-[protein]-cysteine methyltransferase